MSKPQRILMLAFPDCQMLDVTGPLQMFAGVNDELGRQAYELVIAAPTRGPFKTSSGITIQHLCSRRDIRIGPPHRSSRSLPLNTQRGARPIGRFCSHEDRIPLLGKRFSATN
jgi:hypothetical protein